MRKQISAKVIADSITERGHRLTTFEVTMPRFVLAEFNTHRVFSRNSASSRAIPSSKQLSAVMYDPVMPVQWGVNQPGMQASGWLVGDKADRAAYMWLYAREAAYTAAKELSEDLNVHKQVVNRILEPWMWHTVIVSATDWVGFWNQRISPLAQPEIKAAAEAMMQVYLASEPALLREGQYHLPYIQDDEGALTIEQQIQLSAARCARVSYLTHDGVRDHEKDYELYERLVSAQPPHSSPLEHVATPYPENVAHIVNTKTEQVRSVPILGNFVGWRQHRSEVADEIVLLW